MRTAIARSKTDGRKLSRLAVQINGAHTEFEACLRKTFETALRVGKLLTEAKALCGHGAFGKWIAEHTSVTPRRVQQYMQVYRRRDELPNAKETSHLGLDGALTLLRDQAREALTSSDCVEWYTPPSVVDRVLEVLGNIDLDPCSNRGEPNIPARRHYTIDDDGLIRPWRGKVYMNPPFGKGIERWVDKLIAEHESRRVTEAIAMLPDATSSTWFQPLWRFLICFASPRIRFVGSSGNENSNTLGSAIVYMGDNPDRFCKAFDDVGAVTTRFNR